MRTSTAPLLLPQNEQFSVEAFYRFLNDPVYMQKVIFDRDLHPGQRIETRLMWFAPLYEDNSGYRWGKSSNATYVQMCQCMLIPNWHEGILSHTLRGSQYLFRDYIINEYETNELFRSQVRKPPTRGNEWRVEFVNGSSTTAFPSDIMNNSMRLESLSLHGCTIDEFTSFPNADVIWDVMLNRVTRPVPRLAQLLGITNTVRLTGAAKFSFQSVYKQKDGRGGVIEMAIKRMAEWARGDMSEPMEDLFMSFNIEEHLPPDEVCWACGGTTEYMGMTESGKEHVRCLQCGYQRIAWHRFLKAVIRTMKNAKALMGRRLYMMRWMGKWQDSSEDVYSAKAVRAMPRFDVKLELRRPDDEVSQRAVYGVGVDIGTGATERHSVSAITVVKYCPPDPRYRIVYTERHSCSLSVLSGHIYRIWELFVPNIIMIDPGGGGVWLVDNDHLGGREQTVIENGKKVKKENTTPLLLIDNQVVEEGARVISLFTPGCLLATESIGTMVSSDQMINWAHDLLSGMIDNGLVLAPMTMMADDGRRVRTAESIFNSIQEALEGLTRIGIVLDAAGQPDLTKNGFFQYSPKPDAAYSFAYAMAGLYLWINSNKERIEQTSTGISIKAVNLGEMSRSPRGVMPETSHSRDRRGIIAVHGA